ncbi:hypothetical protein ACIQNG_21550 [Streptomyces sp. NPDC091377]|uniref:hypothetical protein n=1 Tax=Streptomyces sp. NPDC091377 TaxID=3365995 RepID=UPI0038031D71
MQIPVTAGAGFIGSSCIRMLVSDGEGQGRRPRATVLDTLTYAGNPADPESVAGRIASVQGDIRERGPAGAGIQVVAGRGAAGEVRHTGSTAELTNRELTTHLLEGLGPAAPSAAPQQAGNR